MKRSRNTSQPCWVYRYGECGGRMDGWMEECWRDDGERLDGSTWQLIERGSRVATLCNLLAGPWCMQAWYQQTWQTHARMRESSEERQACVFIDSGAKKGGSCLLPSFIVKARLTAVPIFLHCTNSRLASSRPYREIILSPLAWRLLADLISAAASGLPDLTSNLAISLLITMLCWCGTYSLCRFVCDKVNASGLLMWDWSRMPWQLSAIITREPDHTHKYANIHISPD